MGNYRESKIEATLTAGGSVTVELDPDLSFRTTTVVTSGNTTGTITLTKKVVGATRYTAFEPAATLDLSLYDERIIEGMALSGLTLTHAGTGSDINLTIVQYAD